MNGSLIDAWPAWLLLPEQKHKEIWDKFRQRFEFNISVFPAIKEPVPSVTYWITNYNDDSYEYLQKSLSRYFQHLIPEGEWIYVIDWRYPVDKEYDEGQDISYKFYPHLSGDCPVNLLSEGYWGNNYRGENFYIFTERNFEFGVFGNTQEQTMCVFGESLLNEVEKEKAILFDRVLRRNGLEI
jgi:hypothetical protein